jgi:FemAB-related protein (PEP-CTERM system-associated)
MKNGLISKVGGIEDLETFYDIYARNVRDMGSPVYPVTFFKALLENLKDSFILSVWKDEKMVAGVLTFVFKDIVIPYYGGGLREYFHYASNDFMYWELMRYGCEKGYRVFDFGRSKKDTGPYHFKRHWGFEPEELNYCYYLVKAKDMPNVSPVNPKYKLFINIWKRLPLAVTNWIGPKLVRSIP